MLSEQMIWRLTKMTDVCITNIIPDKTFNASDYNSKKWSDVIALDQFSYIHDLAYEIYAILTENGIFCPRVSKLNHYGLELIYSNNDLILKIWIEPDTPLKYALGDGPILEMAVESILHETLAIMCRFLDSTIETPIFDTE